MGSIFDHLLGPYMLLNRPDATGGIV